MGSEWVRACERASVLGAATTPWPMGEREAEMWDVSFNTSLMEDVREEGVRKEECVWGGIVNTGGVSHWRLKLGGGNRGSWHFREIQSVKYENKCWYDERLFLNINVTDGKNYEVQKEEEIQRIKSHDKRKLNEERKVLENINKEINQSFMNIHTCIHTYSNLTRALIVYVVGCMWLTQAVQYALLYSDAVKTCNNHVKSCHH